MDGALRRHHPGDAWCCECCRTTVDETEDWGGANMIATRAPDLTLVVGIPFGFMLVAGVFCWLLFRLLSRRN
jgi:hypothetical protein